MDPKESIAPPASPEPSSATTGVSSEQIQQSSDNQSTSTPLEMNRLPSHSLEADQSIVSQISAAPSSTLQANVTEGMKEEQISSTPAPQSQPQDDTAVAIESNGTPSQPNSPWLRQESSAIGPDTDSPVILTNSSIGPAVFVTLLLISGARHPYKIDEPYLRKRNIASAEEEIDPFTISVYTMKELIWRDWRHEWESRPSSPSFIRLIHFGKLLDDKSTLREYFKPDIPNVVHMNVKPQDLGEDDDNTKMGNQHAHPDEDDGNVGCCRCIIL